MAAAAAEVVTSPAAAAEAGLPTALALERPLAEATCGLFSCCLSAPALADEMVVPEAAGQAAPPAATREVAPPVVVVAEEVSQPIICLRHEASVAGVPLGAAPVAAPSAEAEEQQATGKVEEDCDAEAVGKTQGDGDAQTDLDMMNSSLNLRGLFAPQIVLLLAGGALLPIAAGYTLWVQYKLREDYPFPIISSFPIIFVAGVCWAIGSGFGTYPALWFFGEIHGGCPRWFAPFCASVLMFLRLLEALRRRQNPVFAPMILGIGIPVLMLVFPGRRKFGFCMAVFRIFFQIAVFYATMFCTQLQARLSGQFPFLAANLFIIMGIFYKALCVPIMLCLWNSRMRGSCPLPVLAATCASIRYTLESLFYAGIILGFLQMPEREAIWVSLQSILSRSVFQLVGRLGLVDAVLRLVPCLQSGRVLTYEKELFFRTASLQVYAQCYGLSFCAAMALVPALTGLRATAALQNPILWLILAVAMLSGIVVEVLLALIMRRLRTKRWPGQPALSLFAFLARMSEAGVNEFVSFGGKLPVVPEPVQIAGAEASTLKGCHGMSPSHMMLWLSASVGTFAHMSAAASGTMVLLSSQ